MTVPYLTSTEVAETKIIISKVLLLKNWLNIWWILCSGRVYPQQSWNNILFRLLVQQNSYGTVFVATSLYVVILFGNTFTVYVFWIHRHKNANVSSYY